MHKPSSVFSVGGSQVAGHNTYPLKMNKNEDIFSLFIGKSALINEILGFDKFLPWCSMKPSTYHHLKYHSLFYIHI